MLKGTIPNLAAGKGKTISFKGVVLQNRKLAGIFPGTARAGKSMVGPQ